MNRFLVFSAALLALVSVVAAMAQTESQQITPIASVAGDPHFRGLAGQKFKVLGLPGKVYNLISTPTLQVNALFVANEDQVVIGELGIKVRDDSLFMSRKARLRLNDKPVDHSAPTTLGHGTATITRDNDKTVGGPTIVTPEFTIIAAPRGYELDLQSVKLNVAGGSSIHGLLGQTWKSWEVKGDQEMSDADAWKHLEGSLADYEVKDGLFGDNFAHNRFSHHFARHAVPKVSDSN